MFPKGSTKRVNGSNEVIGVIYYGVPTRLSATNHVITRVAKEPDGPCDLMVQLMNFGAHTACNTSSV